MPVIKLVTDTDASLPLDLLEELNIGLVPINIHFGEETYRTCFDLDDKGLFERIDAVNALPTTSAPTPGQFLEVFQQAFDEGADQVLCFSISSVMSATYTAACQARDMLEDKDITVVDTLSVSMGQGFMVLAAADAINAGASVDEAIAAAMSVRERFSLFGAFATLKYLAMSGRVGQVAAGMAHLLNIKPILTLVDGKLDLLEKVRTRKKAWNRAIELTRESLNGRPVERMAIVHVCAAEQAAEFEVLLRSAIDCPEDIMIVEFTAGLSVHTGPGMIAVVAQAAE